MFVISGEVTFSASSWRPRHTAFFDTVPRHAHERWVVRRSSASRHEPSFRWPRLCESGRVSPVQARANRLRLGVRREVVGQTRVEGWSSGSRTFGQSPDEVPSASFPNPTAPTTSEIPDRAFLSEVLAYILHGNDLQLPLGVTNIAPALDAGLIYLFLSKNSQRTLWPQSRLLQTVRGLQPW